MSAAEALQTQRFVLEPIVAEHAAALFPDLLSPELYLYIPDVPPSSIQELNARFSRWSRRASAANDEIWYNYAIKWNETEEYAGTLQATVTGVDASIAYQVFPRYWRRGIAHEACLAMLARLRADGVQRVVANVDTRNVASQALLESLGFVRVSRIEAADQFKGAVSHEYVYQLLVAAEQ